MNQIKPETRQISKKVQYLLLALFFCVSVVTLYLWNARSIEGPYVTQDEPLYFNLARHLHLNFSFQGHQQYGPLYPLVISVLFFAKSEQTIYRLVQIFNILVYSSAILPFFWVSSKLIRNRLLAVISAGMFLFFPMKTLVGAVWAEPLFIPLIAWCMVVFLKYQEKKTIGNSLGLGILLGLLYLAKSSGLVLFIAVFLVSCYDFLFIEKQKRRAWKYPLLILAGAMAFVLPWMYRNTVVSAGALGYQSEVALIRENLFAFEKIAKLSLYQISYLVVGTGLVFFLLYVLALIETPKRERASLFKILIGVYIIGLVLICAFHHSGDQAAEAAYGRYLTMVIPYIILLGIQYYEQRGGKWSTEKRKLAIGIGVAMALVILVASPFHWAFFAKGYASNFDLTIWDGLLVGGDGFAWSPPQGVEALPVVVILAALCVVFFSWNREKVRHGILALLCCLCIVGGIQGNNKIIILAHSQKDTNELLRLLEEKGYAPSEIIKENMGSAGFYDLFWFGEYFETLPREMEIYFGGETQQVPKDALRVFTPDHLMFRGVKVEPEEIAAAQGKEVVKAMSLSYQKDTAGRVDFYVGEENAKRIFGSSYREEVLEMAWGQTDVEQMTEDMVREMAFGYMGFGEEGRGNLDSAALEALGEGEEAPEAVFGHYGRTYPFYLAIGKGNYRITLHNDTALVGQIMEAEGLGAVSHIFLNGEYMGTFDLLYYPEIALYFSTTGPEKVSISFVPVEGSFFSISKMHIEDYRENIDQVSYYWAEGEQDAPAVEQVGNVGIYPVDQWELAQGASWLNKEDN